MNRSLVCTNFETSSEAHEENFTDIKRLSSISQEITETNEDKISFVENCKEKISIFKPQKSVVEARGTIS